MNVFGVIMAQRIFYEIDGRVGGPVSFVQLQMMATSGMLQEHHRVRLEDTDTWVLAKQVRNLFDSPAAVPVGRALPAVPSSDSWNADPPPETPGANSAFDFFSDPEPESLPPEAPKKSGKSRPATKASDPAPTPSPFVGENLNELGTEVKPQSGEFSEAVPVESDMNEAESQSPGNAPTVTTKLPNASSSEPPSKVSTPTSRPTRKPDAKAADESAITVIDEVLGQAVEVLPADAARLQDGRITFRLQPDWLLAATKFNDGTTKNVYLRLSQIDSAVLEQRPATRRNKGGPFPVLAFTAGITQVALAFQGSEKPYRAFLEKVLQLGNSARQGPK